MIPRRPPPPSRRRASPIRRSCLQASDAAFNGAVDEGALLQASAAKAGIKVDLKKEPADGFWDNVWLKGAFVSSYWGGRAAATQMLSVAYAGQRALERDALEQREVREAARRRARRNRRSQAQALHLGNAGDAQRAGRRDHPRVQGLARRASSTRSAAIRRTAASTWTTAISCRRPGSRADRTCAASALVAGAVRTHQQLAPAARTKAAGASRARSREGGARTYATAVDGETAARLK